MNDVHERSFASRTAPREARDFLWGLLLVLVLGSVLVGAGLLLGEAVDSWRLGRRIALLGFIVVFLVLSVGTPTHAVVGPEGIRFRRLLGAGPLVPWSAVTRIAEAPAGEVFRKVWLWPGLPPRGSIWCASVRHHYRFEWDGRRLYFPPRDERAFRAAVERWHPVETRSPVRPGD